jgi:hypothetical protein
MRPYLIEGLDCSGKKTVARLVAGALQRDGVNVDVVIGPVVGGLFGRVDASMARRGPLHSGSTADRLRRAIYVLGPIVDGLGAGRLAEPTIKVSSHYRAWSRALLDGDRLVTRAFGASAKVHLRFCGGTLLATRFDVRLARHQEDVLTGKTTRKAEARFLGPDKQKFDCWHQVLRELLDLHVPALIEIDSTDCTPEEISRLVVPHILTCWQRPEDGAAQGMPHPTRRIRERD